jgi:hypothetical protein
VPTLPGQSVFQLRVTLLDVEPTVWRRVLVPGSIRLPKLHAMLQAAMGWTNSHLHRFDIGDRSFGMLLDEDDEELYDDENDVTVLRAISEHPRFAYEYDFGDGWEHDIVVEEMLRLPHGLKFAVCLGGENACPPEDCGGDGGYRALLEALANPAHEDHDELLEWIGGPFDPTHFDVAQANADLQRVR